MKIGFSLEEVEKYLALGVTALYVLARRQSVLHMAIPKLVDLRLESVLSELSSDVMASVLY